MRGIEPTDLAALTTSQLVSFSTDQLCALTQNQLAALSTTQTAALGSFTPLALDLNGAGVQTTAISSGTRFDLNGDGTAERVGWVADGDALLARDVNGDGVIDSGKELFGAATALPDGNTARDGFEALAALDANRDGVVDSSDPAFRELLLWQDSNGDGVSSAGELKPLSEASITSLGTKPAVAPRADQGNIVGLVSDYSRADGATGELADVWLLSSAAGSGDVAGSLLDALERYGEQADDPPAAAQAGAAGSAVDSTADAMVAALASFRADASLTDAVSRLGIDAALAPDDPAKRATADPTKPAVSDPLAGLPLNGRS
jgi:hypothetical protein